jgi:hypothetical protein
MPFISYLPYGFGGRHYAETEGEGCVEHRGGRRCSDHLAADKATVDKLLETQSLGICIHERNDVKLCTKVFAKLMLYLQHVVAQNQSRVKEKRMAIPTGCSLNHVLHKHWACQNEHIIKKAEETAHPESPEDHIVQGIPEDRGAHTP